MVSVTNKSAPVVSTTGNFVSLSLLSGSVQQENGIISRDLTVRRAHSTTKDITCFDFHSTELKKTGGAMSSRANVESLTISPPITTETRFDLLIIRAEEIIIFPPLISYSNRLTSKGDNNPCYQLLCNTCSRFP